LFVIRNLIQRLQKRLSRRHGKAPSETVSQQIVTGNKTYIFRSANRKKAVDLRHERDYHTGLSFWDAPPSTGKFVVYEVKQLRLAGFKVFFDGDGEYARDFIAGKAYIEPNSGQPVIYDEGHVTVIHTNTDYWLTWYQADKVNIGSEDSSPQLDYFWNLRVDGPTDNRIKWS
jgi:hypothetical protein